MKNSDCKNFSPSNLPQTAILNNRELSKGDIGGSNLQVAGHCFTNTESILFTFLKANLGPKNFCLGLIRPKVSFEECLGYFLYR